MQQGLLFHAGSADGSDDLYAVQLDIAITGALDADRLRDAVQAVVARHPNLAARFCDRFDEPVQVIPADPVLPWRYVDLRDDDAELDLEQQMQAICAAERAAVSDLAEQPAFRAIVVRIAEDRHRFVRPITTSCSTAGRRRSCCGKCSPAITGSDWRRPRHTAAL